MAISGTNDDKYKFQKFDITQLNPYGKKTEKYSLLDNKQVFNFNTENTEISEDDILNDDIWNVYSSQNNNDGLKDLNKIDSVTYKNNGETTANNVFSYRNLISLNDRKTSDDIMNQSGFDISKLKKENIIEDGNGITYHIDNKYYRVLANSEDNANIVCSEIKGDDVKTELFDTNVKVENKYATDSNGNLNTMQINSLAKEMIKNQDNIYFGIKNETFKNLNSDMKNAVREAINSINTSNQDDTPTIHSTLSKGMDLHNSSDEIEEKVSDKVNEEQNPSGAVSSAASDENGTGAVENVEKSTRDENAGGKEGKEGHALHSGADERSHGDIGDIEVASTGVNTDNQTEQVSTGTTQDNKINTTEENDEDDDEYASIKTELRSVGWDKEQANKLTNTFKENLENIQKQLANKQISNDEFIERFENIHKDLSQAKLGPNGDVNDLNRVIGSFSQGNNGDCLILSDLKGLSSVYWGKSAIRDAISLDGQGGASVKFQGAETSNNTHAISKSEIDEARNNGWVSSGDTDVAVIELALKKHIGIKPSENLTARQLGNKDLVTLLCGNKIQPSYWSDGESINPYFSQKEDSAFNFVQKSLSDWNSKLVTCGFKNEDLSKNIATNHAYNITGVSSENGKEYINLLNPWDTSAPLKIEKEFFDNNVGIIRAYEKSIMDD